jgi:hypothetical protein
MKFERNLKRLFGGNSSIKGDPRSFTSFSTTDWVHWIDDVLDGTNDDSWSIDGHVEIHRKLKEIYQTLEDKTSSRSFSEAVGILFDSTLPIVKNSERIYHLLQLAVYVRPLSVNRLLKKWLIEESLVDVEFGSQKLHALLFAVIATFGLDDDIVDYLRAAGSRTDNFPFLLVAFRSLFKENVQQALEYLRLIVPRLESETRSLQLSEEIEYLLISCGSRQLNEWYLNNFEVMEERFEIKFNLLESAMLKALSHYLIVENDEAMKTYSSILMKIILMKEKKYSLPPKEVLEITRMHRIVGVKNMKETMRAIWIRSARNFPSNVAWYFDPTVRVENFSECFITNDLGKSVSFQTNKEPIVYEILEGVKETMVDSKSRSGSRRSAD